MSKTKKTEEAVVEEVHDAQVNNAPTTEADDVQPEPRTENYDTRIQLTDRFINDLIVCLGEAAYIQSAGFIAYAQQNKNDISIADLNEYIKKLETLPWKFVHQLLQNISDENGRRAYFAIKETKNV